MNFLRALFLAPAALVAACTANATQAPPGDVLSRPAGPAEFLTASGGYVYWVGESSDQTWSIARVAESGGAIQTIAASVAQPGGLSVSGSTVYFTDTSGNALLSIPATGLADGQAPTIVAKVQSPTSVVIVSDDAYVIQGSGSSGGPLLRLSLDGSSPPAIVATTSPSNLVTDGTAAYFATTHQTSPTTFGSTVARDVAGDLAAQNLVGSGQPVGALAVNGADVVSTTLELSSQTDYDLVLLPIDAGTSVTLATGLPSKASVAATSTAVYWSDTSGTWTVPLSGGAATQVSSYQAQLTADGDHVFGVEMTPSGPVLVAETR